jgi:TPR repeat protein
MSFAQLLQAAENGNVTAQVRVGIDYATGSDVKADGLEAIRWLERAASAGGRIGASAAGWLGAIYQHGMGVPKSGASAMRWYERGAELGGGASAQNIAEMYFEGKLVNKDRKLTDMWYARAANLYEQEAAAGDALAAYQAGRIYKVGMGVPKDRAKAVALLEMASKGGNADATRLLGEMGMQPGGH